MTLKIGRKKYPLNTAMISLLRYRKEFHSSFFRESSDGAAAALAAVRLVWASIEGDKPDFPDFLDAAAAASGFLDQALAVQQAVLYTDAVFTEANAPSAGDDDLDELTVLALMASSGLDYTLVYDLPVFAVIDVIKKYNHLRTGVSEKPANAFCFRKMDGAQVRKLYGR